jgi:hypothetical protein
MIVVLQRSPQSKLSNELLNQRRAATAQQQLSGASVHMVLGVT